MENDALFLFVCDVLPTTRIRAFLRAALVALALAAGVVLLAMILDAVIPALGPPAVLFPTLGMLLSIRPNPVLRFYREYESRKGAVASKTRVWPTFWLVWVLGASIILLSAPSPLQAAVMIFPGPAGLIIFYLIIFRRPVRLLRELAEASFIYLAYPDNRFRAVGGGKGLWLPAQTMTRRTVRFAAQRSPLYVVLAVAMARWFSADVQSAPVAVTTLCVLLLLASPYLLFVAAQLGPLGLYARARRPQITGSTEWERAVNLVANSKWKWGDLALADHYFIGWHLPRREAAPHPFKTVSRWDLPCRTPALLHRSVVNAHGHVLGTTGSHKTSVGLTTLLIQMIRGWTTPAVDQSGSPVRDAHGRQVWSRSEPMPILIIDMKGDSALFNTIKDECRRNGRRFKFFSLSKGAATSYFNPLLNLGIHDRHVAEFCEVLLNALSLFHGLSYGRGYFSKQSRDLLLTTLKAAKHKPETWEELHSLLLSQLNPKTHKDVFELVSSIFVLAQYFVLGKAPPGVDVIHMPTEIAECNVLYFNLPARLSALSARDVGKLALFSFITAAADYNDRLGKRRCVAAIDESQILASPNVATLFQQASGAKTSLLLVNQGTADLNVPDAPNLSDTVRINTSFKQMFTVPDPEEAADLIRTSGERLSLLRKYTRGRDAQGGFTCSISENETLCPVLTQNDINYMNNDATGSLIQVTTDAGLTTLGGVPHHIQTPYPMSLEEYQQRLYTPWPTAPETTDTASGTTQTIICTTEPKEVEARGEQDYARLMELFRQTARRAGRDRMRDWIEPD